MSARILTAALVLLAAAPLAAQQDTSMAAPDTAMMPHDTGMTMSSDTGMMDHGKMMKDEGMATSEAYKVTEANGHRRLTLTQDFTVPAGSDLYLLLSTGPTDKGALTLGKLKQPAAGQSFDLPKKDLGKYTTLVVWSKKEKKAVATEDFHAPGAMGH